MWFLLWPRHVLDQAGKEFVEDLRHPCGEKPGHAGPEDHRVVTDLRHL
jgi:hypothetical protein